MSDLHNDESFTDVELVVRAAEQLEDDIDKELQIPDPTEKQVVQLVGSGKLVGALGKNK